MKRSCDCPVVDHHIEIGWSTRHPDCLEARCLNCDDAVTSNPLPDTLYDTMRAAQRKLRALINEAECHPNRRGPYILFTASAGTED